MSATMKATGTSLALVSAPLVPQVAYAPGGIQAILDEVARKARSENAGLDISSLKGRKAIASLAHKVSTTKTGLDGLGKELTDRMRQQMEGVLADRSLVKKTLDELRDEIRQPLDEWEARDEQRQADHRSAIQQMLACAQFTVDPTPDECDARVTELAGIYARNWEEFAQPAAKRHEEALDSLTKRRAEVVREEEARAEAARVEAELAEKARQEAEALQQQREAQIAAEAAERARVEAERKAEEDRQRAAQAAAAALRAEQERAAAEQRRVEAEREAERQSARAREEAAAAEQRRVEAQVRENEQRAAREQARLERERAEAEARATAAEQRRAREAAEAEQSRQAAAEAAEQAVQQAREQEAARIRAAEDRKRCDAEARERDRAHRARVHREAAAGLILVGLTDEQADAVLNAIAAGQVSHCSISY